MGGCVRKPHKNLEEREKDSLDHRQVVQGVKITKNPISNKLEGIPEEWALNCSLPLSIDYRLLAKTKHLPEEIRPEVEMPQEILELINGKAHYFQDDLLTQEKSAFVNTEVSIHNMEVDFDRPFGIKNLPMQWEEQLGSALILPSQVISNPHAMIEIISTFDEIFCESVISKKLLSTRQFERIVERVEFIQDNPCIDYRFEKSIGQGGVCKVFYACNRQESKKEYAVRVIKINEAATLKKIKGEIAVMHICQNPNTIEHHFSFYYKESLFMFIQYMDYGPLTKLIKAEKAIPEEMIAYIIKQILMGLKAIHKKSQIHRDLKSDNILLSAKGEVKIADFGHALQLTKQKLQPKDIVGTPAWMAPELIKKEPYNQSADIWSLGIVTIQLFTGEPPHLRLNMLKAMYNIVSQPAPTLEGCSRQMKDFTSRCLQKDPENRASVQDLLKHPFLSSIKNQFKLKMRLMDLISRSINK